MGRKARTNPAQLHGLGNKKKSGRGRDIFLDFPLYRTYQDLDKDELPGIKLSLNTLMRNVSRQFPWRGLNQRFNNFPGKLGLPRDEKFVRVLLKKHRVFAVHWVRRSWPWVALKRVEEPAILAVFN